MFNAYQSEFEIYFARTVGYSKNWILKVLSQNSGWTLVPTDLILSTEDLLYLNVNQIAPLWITNQAQIADGIKLEPLRVYTHDFGHFINQATDYYVQEKMETRLLRIQDNIYSILSYGVNALSIGAAYYYTHELYSTDEGMFMRKPETFTCRFANPSDLGPIYEKVQMEDGKSITEFLIAIRDLIQVSFKLRNPK
ncbi:MAG: hypothetical protein WA160_06420 [Pseudobdellovibrio sp.]